ncbi:methylated-DNA--[protein]-cysteine S-methyltransferase [Bordetella trematum]|uniref:methylated-DNA--[protein]-cysteine S-methyltransferase n=1 Tax=Bordetella trematum TaxID=123899 RepID=UPI001558E2D6|nr:methylated-DNA--[protein]-cysteine S-methyltransferase [Bordetella trematum]
MSRVISEAAALETGTPLGAVRLMASEAGLCGLWFVDQADLAEPGMAQASPQQQRWLVQAEEQLKAWFAGERRDFDLPLAPQGTPFQRKVWDGLLALPFGTTVGYGELARRLGQPGAARALAQAVGRNPISIIIPCHRVIGSDTALTGFGGGLARKRELLLHEGNRYSSQAARARRVNDGQMDLPW